MRHGTALSPQVLSLSELLSDGYGEIRSYVEVSEGRTAAKKYVVSCESGIRLFGKVREGALTRRDRYINSLLIELANAGLPLCAPIAFGETQDGRFSSSVYPLLEHSPALSMDSISRQAMVVELGRSLRTFHELTRIDQDACLSLARQIRGDLEWLESRGALQHRTKGTALHALQLLEHIPHRNACLIHGDLHGSNVMYDGNRLILCDFDSAYYSDPLLDLAILRRQSSPAVFSAVMEGYGDISPLLDQKFVDCLDAAFLLRQEKGAFEASAATSPSEEDTHARIGKLT